MKEPEVTNSPERASIVNLLSGGNWRTKNGESDEIKVPFSVLA